MEPLVPPPAAPTTVGDPREHIDDLLGGHVDRSDIDVRTFLLDPPPTEHELARTERRRMLVRRGSVAVAAIVAVLLVAPWPSGGREELPETTAAPSEVAVQPEPVDDIAPRAERLDVAPAPPRPAARRSTRSRARPAPRAAPIPAPVSPAPASPAPEPQAAPRPAPARPSTPAPAPASPVGDAIQAPIS